MHLQQRPGLPFTVSRRRWGPTVAVDGSWSDRSARLIALEGAFAAEEMIIEDFSDALGTLPTRPSPL